jgi:hypothetical protein
MPAWLEYEPRIRLIAFGSLFAILAVLEIVLPRRPLTVRKGWRWASNLALVALNSVALRYISKNIIEAHGGSIWAKNNSTDKGATFSLSLPLSN